jgi:hypothetical protein
LLADLARGQDSLPHALLLRADGIVTGWIAARVRRDLDELPQIWSRFGTVKPFWK